jgi:hypothetical protein
VDESVFLNNAAPVPSFAVGSPEFYFEVPYFLKVF